MAAKGTRVTQQEKEKMWRLYQELKTYKAVAEKMKRDPGTVSRHVREYEAAVGAIGYALSQKSSVLNSQSFC